MDEEVNMIIDIAVENMQNALTHLDRELGHLRAGKASTKMLDSIMVDYYGTMTNLNQTASVTTPDAKTIAIQPWEKQMIGPIEKAIINANLGLNPDNNGDLIRIFVPPLTEERRKILVRDVNKEGETAKISLRSTRKEANDQLKKLLKEGLSEDMEKDATEKVQKLILDFSKKTDEMINKKNVDIMTI